MSAEQLNSYEEALAQYQLHPEAKFHNGDYLDSGVTGRRHIVATAVEHIGKEANRWEEQFYLGPDVNAQTEYGTAPEDQQRILEIIRRASDSFGQRALAKEARDSLREVSAAVNDVRELASTALRKLSWAATQLEAADQEQAKPCKSAGDGQGALPAHRYSEICRASRSGCSQALSRLG